MTLVEPCLECGALTAARHHPVPVSLGGRHTIPFCPRCHALAHGLAGAYPAHQELTVRALRERRARGEVTNHRRLGERHECERVLPMPEELAALNTAKLLRRAGLSWRAVAKALEAMHPRAKGNHWHARSLQRALQRQREDDAPDDPEHGPDPDPSPPGKPRPG